MKALIPAAGRGTRLFPHTHTKPKAMVRLAGRPILGHILNSISETEIDEVIVVVGGPMKQQIVGYAEEAFGDRFRFEFPVQGEPEGLGHSVYTAESEVGDEPVMIALGDMLFENGYREFIRKYEACGDLDGAVGVKQVDEPRHYGIVDFDSDGLITELVEKPDDPPSDWAISGVYFIRNSPALFESLEHLVSNDIRGAGNEFQLTDALQLMVERGSRLGTFEVENWYDCGRPETLLEANRIMLDRQRPCEADVGDDAVIIPPVDVDEGVTIEASVVGPNVSIDSGSTVTQSLVVDSIVGREATIRETNLRGSIVGDKANVEGTPNHVNVGDNSSLSL